MLRKHSTVHNTAVVYLCTARNCSSQSSVDRISVRSSALWCRVLRKNWISSSTEPHQSSRLRKLSTTMTYGRTGITGVNAQRRRVDRMTCTPAKASRPCTRWKQPSHSNDAKVGWSICVVFLLFIASQFILSQCGECSLQIHYIHDHMRVAEYVKRDLSLLAVCWRRAYMTLNWLYVCILTNTFFFSVSYAACTMLNSQVLDCSYLAIGQNVFSV